MYKAAARALIRRNIRLLNEGRYEPALAMFARDAQLTFPGQNSWSRQYRIPRNRGPSATHRGRDEIESFLRRYVEHGIQMEVEDILVNGPPWNMRAAVRVHDWIPGPRGVDAYVNRAVLMVRVVWGKIRSQEDYEDTERVSAFDLGYSLIPVASGTSGVTSNLETPAMRGSDRGTCEGVPERHDAARLIFLLGEGSPLALGDAADIGEFSRTAPPERGSTAPPPRCRIARTS